MVFWQVEDYIYLCGEGWRPFCIVSYLLSLPLGAWSVIQRLGPSCAGWRCRGGSIPPHSTLTGTVGTPDEDRV